MKLESEFSTIAKAAKISRFGSYVSARFRCGRIILSKFVLVRELQIATLRYRDGRDLYAFRHHFNDLRQSLKRLLGGPFVKHAHAVRPWRHIRDLEGAIMIRDGKIRRF